MGGLLDILSQGGAALQVHQLGAQVTGNNIANAQAPGYHRELTNISAGAALGRGTNASVGRAAVEQLDQAVNTQAGDAAYADARSQALTAVQTSVGALGDDSLARALGEFFNGWRAIANDPSDTAVRTAALGNLVDLTTRTQDAAAQLADARRGADDQIVAGVDEVNIALTRVADLNGAIAAAEAGGSVAADLRDQRELQLRGLAEAVGATRATDAAGNMVVSVGGGLEVVSSTHVQPLQTAIDPTTGMHQLRVSGTTLGNIDGRIGSGTLGGLIAVRDVDLPAQAAALDAFASDLTTAVNGVHAASYGLDGGTGRNLLAPHVLAGAARDLIVDPSVAGQPSLLAAAGGADGAGDNRGAVAMAQLQGQAVAAGNSTTLAASLGEAVADVGHQVASAAAAQSVAQVRLGQATALAESQQGVSIEEQMMALSRFQSGFQAAAKVIGAIDEMLQSLLRV